MSIITIHFLDSIIILCKPFLLRLCIHVRISLLENAYGDMLKREVRLNVFVKTFHFDQTFDSGGRVISLKERASSL